MMTKATKRTLNLPAATKEAQTTTPTTTTARHVVGGHIVCPLLPCSFTCAVIASPGSSSGDGGEAKRHTPPAVNTDDAAAPEPLPAAAPEPHPDTEVLVIQRKPLMTRSIPTLSGMD